jgi:invasion protein IalB
LKTKKAEQERYNNQVPLTAELLNVLQNGTKLTINNTKCTIYKKTENSLIIKLYKARTKGVELFLGERFNQFSIGWNT